MDEKQSMSGKAIQINKMNSVLVAFILCVNTFSKVLSIFVIIPYNIVMMETLAILILALINNRSILLERQTTAILLVVGGIMVYSLLIYQMDLRVIERLLKFIMYGLFSMICVQYVFDKQSLYKAIFIIGFVHLWYLFAYATRRIQLNLMSIDDTMDLSYTSLIFLFSGTEIATNRLERKWVRVLAALSCCSFIYFLIGISVNRGALIAVTCYYILKLVNKCENAQRRTLLFLGVIILTVVIYMNIVSVLKAVDTFTTSCGMVIRPLQKTIQQMEYTDSMISGRENVYNAAIQLITESWVLPNGVAAFDVLKGIYYPHNIFLEAGIEFGLIGLALVMVIILRACYCMIIKHGKYTELVLMFFCLSIPRLMVSSSYWENTFIWPMMVLMWKHNTMPRQNNFLNSVVKLA